MLRIAPFVLISLLSVIAAGKELSDDDDICPIGESCQRPAMLQARSAVRRHARDAVLFKGRSDSDDKFEDSLEAKAAERQRHLMSLNQTHLAFASRLRRTMRGLNESVQWSNDEIDNIVSGFVEDQAASQDSCPARLLESKHQLNELHAQLVDLSGEVQVTEKELHALEIELADIRQLIDSVIEFCQGEETKCGSNTEEQKKMLAKLKEELVEMQQIAGAQVTIDISQQGALSSTTSTSSTGFVSASTSAGAGAGYSPIAWSVSYGVGESSTSSSSSSSTSTSTTGGSSSTTTGGSSSTTTGGWTTSTTTGAITTGGSWSAGGGSSTTTTSSSSTTGAYSTGGYQPGQSYPAALLQGSVSKENQPGSAEGARKLVSETKQLATDLVQCMAKSEKSAPSLLQADPYGGPGSQPTQAPPTGVSYGAGGTYEGGAYHPPATEGPPTCPATLEVDAHVGDATKVVGSGRPLHEGEHSVVECGDINPKYKGAVWLVCTNGRLSAVTKHCFEAAGDAAQCEEYKKNLESTYVKAYVNLVRTIAEYEALVAGANCRSSVYERCLSQNRGNYEKLEDISARMSHLQQMLLDFKQRFASAQRAEAKLKAEIETLTNECHSMDDTVSCLHKVRDAIHLLGLCPGIGRPQFKIPIWTGNWATGEVSCSNMLDEQIDDLLNTLCAQQISEDGTVARAAECSEIEEHTIEGAPTENSARVPLIGGCPNCEGESNADSGLHSRSGHARKCWDPQAVLSGGGCRKNCQNGMKAVMCVYDRGHIANYFTKPTTQTTQYATTQTTQYR